MTPFSMIMTVAYMVSRARAALLAPPASMTDTISDDSMAVTASARTSVPKGSPTRCATISAWCTAATTAAARRSPHTRPSATPTGRLSAARSAATASSGATTASGHQGTHR
jgi:hypothetical protein